MIHKYVSPHTYKCSLCKITFNIGMKEKWKKFNVVPATVYMAAGGGGGGPTKFGDGKSGGSGIVIIRYLTT